jgi:hypothetical protein
MITQELMMYMREALRRKMTFDTIKSELLKVGWAQEDIVRCYDTILNELQSKVPSESPVPAQVTPDVSTVTPSIRASNVVESAPVNEALHNVTETSSSRSFYSQNNIPVVKKKKSFFKIFLVISILVILCLGGATYAGVFLNDAIVQKALIKGITTNTAVESDILLSFSQKQEEGDVATSSFSLKGQYNQPLNQFFYKASFNGVTKETSVNLEIRSIDDVLYVFTQNLPESFMTELLAYENQWFRIPLTKEGILDISTQELQIPSFITDALQVVFGGISDDIKKKVQENTLFKIVKKNIVFVDRVPYYKVEFSLNYDIISEILSAQQLEFFSIEDVRDQAEKIKQMSGDMSMHMLIGVFDGKAHKIEIVSTGQQKGSFSLKALFQFSKKAYLVDAPSGSYTIPEFIEKARSGLIPNVMIGDVPYTDYLEAKRIKEEEDLIQNERASYLTAIVENGSAASFFIQNKKSFSGICKAFFVDLTCRDSRTGFVVYAEINESGNSTARYMCVDAYTKATYMVVDIEPQGMRCQ